MKIKQNNTAEEIFNKLINSYVVLEFFTVNAMDPDDIRFYEFLSEEKKHQILQQQEVNKTKNTIQIQN